MTTIHKDVYKGSKTLSIDISVEQGTATIRFGTREPRWLYWRQAGETTAVFKEADVLLTEMSRRLRKSIILRFDTANTHLKQWILAHEDELGFDDVVPRTSRAYRVTVQKTYGRRGQ